MRLARAKRRRSVEVREAVLMAFIAGAAWHESNDPDLGFDGLRESAAGYAERVIDESGRARLLFEMEGPPSDFCARREQL